ncbi:MAG: DUF5110 domain-containing protein [Oscillospiraceae bacterium]
MPRRAVCGGAGSHQPDPRLCAGRLDSSHGERAFLRLAGDGTPFEIHVYPPGWFLPPPAEDDGDGWDYESGRYNRIALRWDDARFDAHHRRLKTSSRREFSDGSSC